MKKLSIILILALTVCLLPGCEADCPQVAATTLPVYEMTAALCQGTGISVGQLVTESVSCLHDYTLQVSQMRMLERAEYVVTSGAGLEDFLEDALCAADSLIDASAGIHTHTGQHDHADEHDHAEHSHDCDPHIWLSPENAKAMAQNICAGLSAAYPQHKTLFEQNLTALLSRLDALQAYGESTLSQLSCRELITFHDGFGYFAEAFDLTILEAVEEESGSEASAAELKALIRLTQGHSLPAVFTEVNGSESAANILSSETGVKLFCLDMAISGDSYFDAMYHNIDTIKEALG